MNEFADILTAQVVIPSLMTLFSGLIGWVFGRRKEKADTRIIEAKAKEAEIGNLDKMVQMWEKTAESFRNSYSELLEQNNLVNEQLTELRKENKQLTDDVKRLNTMIEELKAENKKLILKLTKNQKSITDEKA